MRLFLGFNELAAAKYNEDRLAIETKYDELSSHLKSTLDSEHHDEVDKLIEAIKEAKADKHETLLVYDC